MKLLLIHADSFSYRVVEEAIEGPEPLTEGLKEASFNECLVAFCTVEEVDEVDPQASSEKAGEAVEEVAKKLNVNLVILYPYAHLSSSLARSSVAIEVLRLMEQKLLKTGFKIHRAPFGWYKAFNLKCKGHPLSELSRSIEHTLEKPKVEAELAIKAEPSRFIILNPSGIELELDPSKMEELKELRKDASLKQLVLNELKLKKDVGEFPPHAKFMVKLGLADYEPSSDVGHLRFYPKGTLLKDLLEAFATDLALNKLKASRVETPLMYRLSDKAIAEQASKFREKDYRFRLGGEEFTLRFAGDFGLFSMVKDTLISYRNLPLRIYELSRSFRLEQKGECVGLKRLRSFTMPDIHCFCRDLAQGMEEYELLFKTYTELARSMEVNFALAFRTAEDFYREHKEWFIKLLNIAGKSALIELLPERKHYWVVKHEYQFTDSVGGNAQLSTVQLDIEDSERYGIYYIDEKGGRRGCIIIHSSMGSIERWIYALLEEAVKKTIEGKPPMLPVWLSPTQVRAIPVSQKYLEHALKVADRLEGSNIRADVDDREESVAKKVRDAEMEWVPYIVVVGLKEVETGLLSVRVRGDRSVRSIKIEELIDEVLKQVEGKVKLPLYEHKLLSLRPRFT